MFLNLPLELQKEVILLLSPSDIPSLLEAFREENINRLFLHIREPSRMDSFFNFQKFDIPWVSLSEYHHSGHPNFMFNLVDVHTLEVLELLDFPHLFGSTNNFIYIRGLRKPEYSTNYYKRDLMIDAPLLSRLIKHSKVMIYNGGGCMSLSLKGIKNLDRITISNCSHCTLDKIKTPVPSSAIRLAGRLRSLIMSGCEDVQPLATFDLSTYPTDRLSCHASPDSSISYKIVNKSIKAKKFLAHDVSHLENMDFQSESLFVTFVDDAVGNPPIIKSVTGLNTSSFKISYMQRHGNLDLSSVNFPNLKTFELDTEGNIEVRIPRSMELLKYLPESLTSLRVNSFNSDLLFKSVRHLINLESLHITLSAHYIGMTKSEYGVFPNLKKLVMEADCYSELAGVIPQITAPQLTDFSYHHRFQWGVISDSNMLSTLKMYPQLKHFELETMYGCSTNVDKTLRYLSGFITSLVVGTDSLDVFCDPSVEFPELVDLQLSGRVAEYRAVVDGLESRRICCSAPKLKSFKSLMGFVKEVSFVDYPSLSALDLNAFNLGNLTLEQVPLLEKLSVIAPLNEFRTTDNGVSSRLESVLLNGYNELKTDEFKLEIGKNHPQCKEVRLYPFNGF